MKKNKFYIVILLLLISIGFAYLSTNLYINGTSLVKANSWQVYFDNIIESSSIEINKNATISSDKKSVDFEVTFEKPGDEYHFYVDIVNNGTIDAMLDLYEITGLTTDQDKFIDWTVTYADETNLNRYDLLKSKNKDTLLVKVQYIEDVNYDDLPKDSDISINLKFKAVYVQADDNYVYRALDPKTRILSLNTEGTQVVTTDHENELRFIGANPNNYVLFNNQKWRIIGIFNGQLKIVQDPIGGYSWDSSASTVNNGYGINQWGPSTNADGTTYEGADLMKLLNPGYENNEDYDKNSNKIKVNNSLYWNAGSGVCYKGSSYSTGNCDFSATGLSDETSKSMIADATWSLGSLDTPGANIWDGRITASLLYEWEKSSNSGKQCSGGTYCNDTVNRTTSWTGKVGLIYPSDYAYATGGGTLGRDDCLSKTVGYVNDSSIPNWQNTYTTCYQDDWLYPSPWIWTMTPRADSSASSDVFSVDSTGYVLDYYAYAAGSVRPVVYLKSSVAFTQEGNGTQSNPFQLKAT